ncbi:hypothetical protein APHAL10511_003365 [Amanita phalloides]|nr:hypothetical protein APHAL10511_003365 [Amanita phalloides]
MITDLAPAVLPFPSGEGAALESIGPSDEFQLHNVLPKRASHPDNVTPRPHLVWISDTSDSEKLPIEMVYSGIQPKYSRLAMPVMQLNELTDSEDDSSLSLDDLESRIDVDDGSDSDESVLLCQRRRHVQAMRERSSKKALGKRDSTGLGNDDERGLGAFEVKIRIMNIGNNTCNA